MRTYLSILMLLVSIAGFKGSAFSQVILNPGFENWTNHVFYYEPDSFLTTNINAYMSTGQGNVTRITNSISGNYAAQLTTVTNGTDTIFGEMFIGTPNSSGITGGRPYHDRPDSLFGFFRYNIMTHDTAMIYVIFKNFPELPLVMLRSALQVHMPIMQGSRRRFPGSLQLRYNRIQ